MKTAALEVRSAASKLVVSDCCKCCGRSMYSRHALAVFDAAQMYEVVPRSHVLHCVVKLLSFLRGKTGVLVWHTPHLSGYLTKRPRVLPLRASWFSPQALLAIVFLVLLQK